MVVLAFLTDPVVVEKILLHLKLPAFQVRRTVAPPERVGAGDGF